MNTPANVGCGACGWRGKRVSIYFKDADYDEYTPPFGECPKCKAQVHTTEQLARWRKMRAQGWRAVRVKVSVIGNP